MAKQNSFTEDALLAKGFTKDPNGNFIPPSNKMIVKIDGGKELILNTHTEIKINNQLLMAFDITPIGKPRMTQSDKWKKRKPVVAYFDFKNEILRQAAKVDFKLPESDFHVIFVLPVPHSIKETEKAKRIGSPHRQKPDVDNMIKALKDSLCKDDSVIWDYRISKYWGVTGKILIYKL